MKKWKKTPKDIILAQMCIYHKKRYDYPRYKTWQSIFFFFFFFLRKWKKSLDILYIILNTCNTNDNHMMHVSWDIDHDIQNVLSFCNIFLPFLPTSPNLPLSPNNPENHYFEKMKKTWRYCHFTHVYQKWQLYYVWLLRDRAPWQNFLSF